jgi:Rrf2 family protein
MQSAATRRPNHRNRIRTMLTHRAKYAIKALLHLVEHRGKGPVSAASIATQQRIPSKFLELILLQLRNSGIIRSKIGKKGGHELIHEPADIDLLTVVRVIDGPIAPQPCLSKTAYSRCEDCPDEKTCGARLLLKGVHEAALEIMGRTTLADASMAKPAQRKQAR